MSQYPLVINSIGPFEGSPQGFRFKGYPLRCLLIGYSLIRKKGGLAEITTQYHLL